MLSKYLFNSKHSELVSEIVGFESFLMRRIYMYCKKLGTCQNRVCVYYESLVTAIEWYAADIVLIWMNYC